MWTSQQTQEVSAVYVAGEIYFLFEAFSRLPGKLIYLSSMFP